MDIYHNLPRKSSKRYFIS